ncbi:MAG: tetratricopeptide repeat protein, partial [Deltaproteobacteria bacterium]|nr:tetratricopeptide repeat protein [Deltaproteobacteria bacterium]
MVIFLLTAALAGGWWLWRNKITDSARFNFISINVNQDIRKLLSGETLSLHPSDRVKILSISTNIPLNLNVRLAAEGFDVNALRYETLTLSDLLPQHEAFDRYKFLIHVKHYNEDIGHVTWVIQPYTEEWLDKANRIIDPDRRLVFLERAHRLSPENGQLNRRLLDEYKALKRWKKAARMLDRMAAEREDPETLTELLEVYREMKDQNGIVLILQQIIKLKPDDLETRKALAETLEGMGDWTGAIREYDALLKRMDEGERLQTYKTLGYLYTKTQNYEKAIDAYLNAAKLDQKDANLHYNLSFLYEKTHQKEKANFYLDNAITLKSEDLEGRLKLAQSFMDKGNYRKARAYLSEVLDKKTDAMKALVLMAKVLEKQSDKKALKTTYQKILSLNPKDPTILYNLGALEYEEGNLKKALPYFRDYVVSHPKDATAHEILFDIYKKENNLPIALKEAIILVELNPKETDIYDFIFDYLWQKGEYTRLIPLLEKGVKA